MKKIILKNVIVGVYGVNCYILGSAETKEAVIIDPGDNYPKIKHVLDKYGLVPKYIALTHAHFDHIGAVNEFGLDVYMHSGDKDFLTNPEKNLSALLVNPFTVTSRIKILEDKQKICLSDMKLEVIHTPGHTPGSICLKTDNMIFTGDTLFAAGIGRTDFPYASESELLNSIKEKLLILPEDMIVYPGHGPATDIGREKKGNVFIKELL